jgi:hypothetical protein
MQHTQSTAATSGAGVLFRPEKFLYKWVHGLPSLQFPASGVQRFVFHNGVNRVLQFGSSWQLAALAKKMHTPGLRRSTPDFTY